MKKDCISAEKKKNRPKRKRLKYIKLKKDRRYNANKNDEK